MKTSITAVTDDRIMNQNRWTHLNRLDFRHRHRHEDDISKRYSRFVFR